MIWNFQNLDFSRFIEVSDDFPVCWGADSANFGSGLTVNFENIENLEIFPVISLGCLLFLIFILIFCLSLQPRSQAKISFRVPFVPLIPCLAIFANIYLMMKLSIATWIRFFIWLFIGLLIYFFYGIRNSSEKISSNESSTGNDNDRTESSYGTIQGKPFDTKIE